MLRSRRTRGEEPLDGLRPEPIIDNPEAGTDPEHEALLADAVGIALQVVLDTLSPAERHAGSTRRLVGVRRTPARSSNDMDALKTAIAIAWIIFWVYWLVSALGAKQGRRSGRRIPLQGLSALSVILLLRVFRGGSLTVHSPVLGAIGAVVFAGGIGVAIWSRVHLGRNWGCR